MADSISAGLPRDRIKALHAVNNTNGAYLTVSDDQIIRAIPDLARKTGVFAEPAGAATWAGMQKAANEGLLHATETVVMINTGSGLKDINPPWTLWGVSACNLSRLNRLWKISRKLLQNSLSKDIKTLFKYRTGDPQ